MKRRVCLAVLLGFFLAASPARAAVEVYFAPGLRDRVASKLGSARRTIDVAMYAFTDSDLAWALVRAKERGVKVRVYLDGGQEKARFAKGRFLQGRGIEVRYYRGSGLMHHKFAVLDRQLVLAGSYNWTAAGEADNKENLLVIGGRAVADSFRKEFERLWQRAANAPMPGGGV